MCVILSSRMVSEDEVASCRKHLDSSGLPSTSDEDLDDSDDPDFQDPISEEDVEDGATVSSAEDTVEVNHGPPCDLCGQVPCDWVSYADEICEVCDELKDGGMANNQVRFQAYREYTRLKHGILRKYDRRPLPMCVRSEIIDAWPDPDGNYTGFHAAMKHAADDSN